MRTRLILGALTMLTLPASSSSADLEHAQTLLSSIKQRMKQNLSRVPNYTCLETISRGRRAPERLVVSVPGKKVPFRRSDVIRLEVAEVGGIELFAHAGAHNFEKSDISEFVNTGLIGNGIFSSFAHDIFVADVPVYKFAGEEQIDGRRLIRFDFSVPQILSGYQIGTHLGRADVGYHGSFWADPITFDAVRIEITADDVPHSIGLTDAYDSIEYARVRIGSADVLLPQSGELGTHEVSGWQSRNDISFTHCREYGVEAVIRFDDVTEASGDANGTGTNFVDLPPGLPLTLTLETALDAGTAHIGDLLSANVEADVKHKGKVVLPKDALVSGRLRRLEIHKEGWPYVLAGLEFTQIEFNGKHSRFFAELEKLVLPAGAEGPRRIESRDLPGIGVVSARGNNLRLPKGTRMMWKTISYEKAAE